MGRLSAKLASRNENKLRELAGVLEDWQLELLAAEDYPPEDGSTYYENARTKARHGRNVDDSTAWILGEDSGIEVDGLGGGPGVHSARLGGDDPVGWLLAELGASEDRGARYVCELVAISPEGDEVRGTGTFEGRIAEEPRGSEGFGYDPVFIPDGQEQTVAELGNAWKREHSHRARAARALSVAVSTASDWSGV
ncbi:MAG: non-canonical purine NTP pyrophosphatase [Actinomycetota bacterium]|nr:non-canonical purine NTP pyrophosphatase [Actinomycetota bacterium]